MADEKKFSGWAVVELMGHVRVAGMVSEETVAGVSLLRVDVPAVEHHPAFTRYYHPNALYSLCPTDEATARGVAAFNRHPPIERWQMPQPTPRPAAIGAPDDYRADDDDDADNEDDPPF